MSRFFFLAIVALFFVFVSVSAPKQCAGESAAGNEPVGRTVLERTIVRYFQSMGGYEEGDLISRSQVQELQAFLRSTNRRGAVTHPKRLIAVLPDNCRLIRLFYTRNGAPVIREAVKKLGSYRELEELTRRSVDYDPLAAAVRAHDVEQIVKMALERREQNQKADSKISQKPRSYTVEEFLENLSASAKGKKKKLEGA